jgi:tRNA threonylcarbamoyladenosine biosynthesis protein TsaE
MLVNKCHGTVALVSMTVQLTSVSAKQTKDIASNIGKRLVGGEVIELVSDVGGGKTTFVSGLAHGAGSTSHVSSPTFKISNTYTVTGPTCNIEKLVHFDFYRLGDGGLIEHELAEYIGDSRVAVVVEWSDIVRHVLPQGRLTIQIMTQADDSRKLIIQAPDKLSYLLKDYDNTNN